MPSRERSCAHAALNVNGSAGLLRSKRWRCNPECHTKPAPTAAVILAKRNTPFSSSRINAPHVDAGAGRWGPYRRAARSPYGVSMTSRVPPRNSLFRRKNSLFMQQDFPASGGAGNRLQATEFAWRPAPKTAQRGRNRAKFSKIPCYFPCFRVFAKKRAVSTRSVVQDVAGKP
jgi:hypothetical protein